MFVGSLSMLFSELVVAGFATYLFEFVAGSIAIDEIPDGGATQNVGCRSGESKGLSKPARRNGVSSLVSVEYQ